MLRGRRAMSVGTGAAAGGTAHSHKTPVCLHLSKAIQHKLGELSPPALTMKGSGAFLVTRSRHFDVSPFLCIITSWVNPVLSDAIFQWQGLPYLGKRYRTTSAPLSHVPKGLGHHPFIS